MREGGGKGGGGAKLNIGLEGIDIGLEEGKEYVGKLWLNRSITRG